MPEYPKKLNGCCVAVRAPKGHYVRVDAAELPVARRRQDSAHAGIYRAEIRAVHEIHHELRLPVAGDVVARPTPEIVVLESGVGARVAEQRVVGIACERLVDRGDDGRRLVRGLVREVIEADGLKSVRHLQPLGAIAVVDVISLSEIRGVDGAVRALEIGDRQPDQTRDFRVHVFLRVVVEGAARGIDRFLDDDLAVHVGEHHPAPGFHEVTDAGEVPALLGLGPLDHVSQVLPERPVHVAPLLGAVVAGGIVPHSVPRAQHGLTVGQYPLLRVPADEPAVELRRRHHPMLHRRQIQIRRDGLRGVRVGVDVEVVFASVRRGEKADDERGR